MIPDFKFMWKQLDGPTASWLFDAIYQYFKQQFKPAIDHLNELSIDNMLLDELKVVGSRNNIPYSVIKADVTPDKYFQIYQDGHSDGPHVINSWYNIIQSFPVYETLEQLDDDIAHIADNTIAGGTVVKCLENNMYYQVIITMDDDVPVGSKVLIGACQTDTLVTVSTPDYSDSKICRYFGEYNSSNIQNFIDAMGSFFIAGDIINYEGTYKVWNTDSFKAFSDVTEFENYDDTVYPGGMLMSDRMKAGAYDYIAIGMEAYRVLLKGILHSDAEIGSLRSLEDILALIIYNDSGSETVGFRYSFEILEQPDGTNTYGDLYLNIGQQNKWKNIVFWRRVIEDFISNMYNYAPKIIVKEEQIIPQYTGTIQYNGDYTYM